MGWFDHWIEDDKEVGPFSHWLEDSNEPMGSDYPCDTCIHNGQCGRQKDMEPGDDCDQWSENKKR